MTLKLTDVNLKKEKDKTMEKVDLMSGSPKNSTTHTNMKSYTSGGRSRTLRSRHQAQDMDIQFRAIQIIKSFTV